jgi:hypothetical protein
LFLNIKKRTLYVDLCYINATTYSVLIQIVVVFSLTKRILADYVPAVARFAGHTTYRRKIMLDNAKKAIASLTEIGVALLALAIVASLLVGASNMAFFGGVVGNITSLVSQLGSAGLAGLISLGVVLWLFQR